MDKIAVYVAAALLLAIGRGQACFANEVPARRANHPKDPQEAASREFWSLTSDGKIGDAIRDFGKHWPDQKAAAALGDKVQDMCDKTCGKYVGRIILSARNFDDKVLYCNYVALYERSMMQVELIYWKPADQWIGYNINVNGNVAKAIAESAKAPAEAQN